METLKFDVFKANFVEGHKPFTPQEEEQLTQDKHSLLLVTGLSAAVFAVLLTIYFIHVSHLDPISSVLIALTLSTLISLLPFQFSAHLRISFYRNATGGRPLMKSDASPLPTPKEVQESLPAYQTELHGIQVVDMEHFLFALKTLEDSEIPVPLKTYEAYIDLGYTASQLDEINLDTYTPDDSDLPTKIIDQNPNPRGQGAVEAVSNELDAVRSLAQGPKLEIGQFAQGVKQILDWLEPTGIDRLDVYTGQEGKPFYHLVILQSETGVNFIQIRRIDLAEFQKQAGHDYTHGTALKVTVGSEIVRTEEDLKAQPRIERRNSQEGILDGIRKAFPFVTDVNILVKMDGKEEESVNGFENKEVIVPPSAGWAAAPSAEKKPSVHATVTAHAITFVDPGKGMDAREISRMFVPNLGTKNAPPLTPEKIQEELKKVQVVRDRTLRPHGVSFARNGMVIVRVEIPEDIAETAFSEGELMLEFGSLLDVLPSNKKIILPTNLAPGQKSNFQKVIELAVEKILQLPDTSYPPEEKLKIINTLVIGLDSLAQGNESAKQILRAIRKEIQIKIAGIVNDLKKNEGALFLPHDKQFEQLAIPAGKKVIFLHENLFDWQGTAALEEIDGDRFEGISAIRGEREVPLVLVPFKEESLDPIRLFQRFWHSLMGKERKPSIKTDAFVAVPKEEWKRLWDLDQERAQGIALSARKEKEYQSLAERLNVVTAEEVGIAGLGKAKENTRIIPVSGIKKSQGEPDSDDVNQFLAHPPIQTLGTETPRVPQVLPDPSPNLKYALRANSDVMEIGSKRTVGFQLEPGQRVGKLELLKNGCYLAEIRERANLFPKISNSVIFLDQVVSFQIVKPVDTVDGLFAS
ncbi:MAG: hypothetical protein HYS58_02690, partial [Elusimicrobia bacterium]|nr:hypothetical protein [Elusimicrobiota bacterium]